MSQKTYELQQYYKGLYFRFSVTDYTKLWHRIEKGIQAESTVSVICFAAVIYMYVLMKATEKECRD